jgi:hypothetical protein
MEEVGMAVRNTVLEKIVEDVRLVRRGEGPPVKKFKALDGQNFDVTTINVNVYLLLSKVRI